MKVISIIFVVSLFLTIISANNTDIVFTLCSVAMLASGAKLSSMLDNIINNNK